jgi:hypothetical protein
MFHIRKIIGILMALIIIISLITPAVDASAANDGTIKAKSKLSGVTYKMRPDVVTMPKGINYELEEEEVLVIPEEVDPNDIQSIAIPEIETIKSKKYIPSDKRRLKKTDSKPRWSRVKEYTPKSITVDSTTKNALTPKLGEIYFDATNQSIMKVAGTPTTDASGMTTIPVEQPELSEVVESVKIPEQTIPLTNDTISYVNEEVRMVTDIYSNNVDEIESLAATDREPMVEIDLSGLDLIDESTDKDHEEALKAKLKAIDDDPSLSEYEKALAKEAAKEEDESLENDRESELKYKAKVEITEGSLKIYKPTLTAYADWGTWGDFEAEATANIDVESDLLIDGDLNISKQVEILIYGYDIDFEIGKLYAGVYLVLGLDGNINFQIRVQQEGTIRVGAKAVGWLIPMAAYPIVEYKSKGLETGITASGELKLWAYAMPKAGLEMFGIKVLSACFKVGLEANVKLDVSSASQSVHLWVDLIFQLSAVVFGNNIDILNERCNLYDKTWAHTSGESIGGGTNIKVDNAYAYLNIDKVDAVRDIISGTAFRSTIKDKDLVACNGEDVFIYITHADGTKSDTVVKVDENGKFVVMTPITPLDRVGAAYSRTDPQYKYNAVVPLTNVQPPYTLTYLFPDAFNSRITGKINGEKYGPNGIAFDEDEVKYTNPVDIIIEKENRTKKTYHVTPNISGEFTLENVVLNKGDSIVSQLVYENAKVISEIKKPELGLEIFIDVKKDLVNRTMSISGSIQNLYGEDLYLGDVTLVGAGTKEQSVVKAKDISEALGLSSQKTTYGKTIKGKTATNQMFELFKPKAKIEAGTTKEDAYQNFIKKNEGSINTSLGPEIQIDISAKKSSPSSVFEFKDIPYNENSYTGVYIEIEYHGIKLQKSIIPAASRPIPPTAERAVVSPVEAYIDSRINYAYEQDMKSIINEQTIEVQNDAMNIDISQNNGISYTMSMIPGPPSGEPEEYHFKENAIQLDAKAGTESITLTWNAFGDATKVKGYNLYRGIAADAESLTPITSTVLTSTKYVDKNVVAGTKYFYLCSVVYQNGDEFIISNEASATLRRRK